MTPPVEDREKKPADPYHVISKTIVYFEHNQPRMDYPRYRQQGLPVNSGRVESLIKQFNRRVKGTEKFWNEDQAETILQLRAAQLSEDGRLSEHLKRRTISPFRQYKTTSAGKLGAAGQEYLLSPTRKGIKTGRLWDSIGDHYHPYVVYTYTPDRSVAGPAAIFKDFEGYLQADAYSAYDALFTSGKIIEVGCMMHARRNSTRPGPATRLGRTRRWRGSNCSTTSNARRRRSTRPRGTRHSSPPGMRCGRSDRGRSSSSSMTGW